MRSNQKGAPERRNVELMLWVDHTTYFGPDRRCVRSMRLRERRRVDLASSPPTMNNAMRSLRMGVINARGVGALAFAERTQGVSLLAQYSGEYETADGLASLAMTAMRGRDRDVRPSLYDGLDIVQAKRDVFH
ncbi:MAG: hypothetical protein AB7O98_15070 [Hyphomonadaceae bacterium]